MSEEKKPLTGLFRDDPATPEGKYLVKRRDGTVMRKPNFVLVATDPLAIAALRAYAEEGECIMLEDKKRAKALGLTTQFLDRLRRLADEWEDYRLQHGDSDPGMGRHRKDDPATIEEMRQGHSA